MLYPQFFLELITTQLRFYMVSPQLSLLIILTMQSYKFYLLMNVPSLKLIGLIKLPKVALQIKTYVIVGKRKKGIQNLNKNKSCYPNNWEQIIICKCTLRMFLDKQVPPHPTNWLKHQHFPVAKYFPVGSNSIQMQLAGCAFRTCSDFRSG